MAITVVSGRELPNLSKPAGVHIIWVDRRSPLGNPFDMLHKESLRDAVCQAFRKYLWLVLEKSYRPERAALAIAQSDGLELATTWKRVSHEKFLEEFDLLTTYADEGDLILVCWCSPKKCHGDVLKRAIEWKLSQKASA